MLNLFGKTDIESMYISKYIQFNELFQGALQKLNFLHSSYLTYLCDMKYVATPHPQEIKKMFLVSFSVVNTRHLSNVPCSPTFFSITTSRIASELQYFMNMWLIQLVCSKEKKMGVGKLKIYLGEREHSVHHPLLPSISCNFMLLLYPSQNKTKQNKNPMKSTLHWLPTDVVPTSEYS